jgi:hypothetical protein
MKMPPDVEATVRLALDAVVVAAGEAQRAPDLGGSVDALDRLWTATRRARAACIEAHLETRRRAQEATEKAA